MIRLATTLLFISAFPTADRLAAQITVGPLVRMMETSDGRGSIEIIVRNETDQPLELTVVLNDWAVDDQGRHTFRPTGTLPESCGTRLDASPRDLRLAGGGAAPVTVHFRTPDSARDDRCRNIIFFRLAAVPDGTGEQLVISTGVKVYVVPAPPLHPLPPLR